MSAFKVQAIELDDGELVYFEVEDVDVQEVSNNSPRNVPKGAEPVSIKGDLAKAGDALKSTLTATCNTIHKGMSDLAPDEWGLELCIGFKGTTNLIPVIVSAEGNVALKVHAKWNKAQTTAAKEG